MVQHGIHPSPNSLLSPCLQGTLARSHSNSSLSLSPLLLGLVSIAVRHKHLPIKLFNIQTSCLFMIKINLKGSIATILINQHGATNRTGFSSYSKIVFWVTAEENDSPSHCWFKIKSTLFSYFSSLTTSIHLTSWEWILLSQYSCTVNMK